MKKMIFLFAIAALIMFQTSCNGSESPSIFDTWSIASVAVDGHTSTNVVMKFSSDGTFSATQDPVGTWVSGTFSPATLPPLTDITITMTAGGGPGAPSSFPVTNLMKFEKLTSTTVDIYLDVAMDGYEGPFQLTRM